ncbi:MAG: aminoglycoside phosphotransferase [Tenericutes bacterium HGW-Tenericutes-6]|nr:MAG: aminoglycoside phosphotransferase [Tenericutes bacterium HGW-Tenericutes-6]
MHHLTLKDLTYIDGHEDFTSIKKIELGWSSDQKYDIKAKNGKRYVLRLSDIKHYDMKKKEFEVIKLFSTLGFQMSMPISFGVSSDEKVCFMLLSFVEGQSLEDALPKLDEKMQYQLGRKAGLILKKIHALKVPDMFKHDLDIKTKKLRQLHAYETSDLRMQGDEKVIAYIKDHIDLMGKQRSTFQHGDFHPGNLILTKDHEIGVIDFNRWDVSDPYEEFYKLECFSAAISHPFARGQLDAYFDDDIPYTFFETLKVYSAHVALYSIKWAEKFGEKDINHMKEMYHMILDHYDDFKLTIPTWYKKEVYDDQN